MGKQPTRSRKQDNNFGKGKVTPVQVAFIVDRYLSDNNFTETRTAFRSEAESLISKSPVREAPDRLLSLRAMLDEYICLKEQKVMLDQERIRVSRLLNGMQTAMNAYNGTMGVQMPPLPATTEMLGAVLPSSPTLGSSAGYCVRNTQVLTQGFNTAINSSNICTPTAGNQTGRKRAGSRTVPNAPLNSKKSRSRLPNKSLGNKGNEIFPELNGAVENTQHLSSNCVNNRSPPQGVNVVKNLFNLNHSSLSPQTNSSGLKTPVQLDSPPSEKSTSPMETTPAVCNKSTPQAVTPTSCTIISSKTVIVSPYKEKTYFSMERSHCISTSSPLKISGKRDNVKGRLNFDGSEEPTSSNSPVTYEHSTPETDEGDIFSIDFPNMDFSSFTDLLVDFDLNDNEFDNSLQAGSPGSTRVHGNHNFMSNQVVSEYSSTVAELVSDSQGQDSLTTIQSITKRTQYSSPGRPQCSPAGIGCGTSHC